ncbi:hypothetical protein SODALDRAFT_294046, partial [Sodiomyces alkalinus F11]
MGSCFGRPPAAGVLPGHFTPLWLAAAGGHSEAARVLLQHGADADFEGGEKDGSDRCVLAAAIESASLQMVRELLMKGADPNRGE